MKKFVLPFLFAVIFISVNAQTKNGTVYSEHSAIEKTKSMWAAFQNGDQESFLGYFADSVYQFSNGNMQHVPREKFKGNVEYWNNSFDNLSIADNKPATPDAIEYKEGGTWVQDWLLFSGTHTETGININVSFHNLYRFNDNGKIDVIYFYFDDSVFEEIENSQEKLENGVVYKNHPYINSVRKVLNAFANKDLNEWESYFNPKARVWYSTMNNNEFQTLEEVKTRLGKQFETQGKVKFIQQGYPDCVHYKKNDIYVVYSWWVFTEEKGESKLEYPIMFSHNFDKDGKINFVMVYFSSNHLE